MAVTGKMAYACLHVTPGLLESRQQFKDFEDVESDISVTTLGPPSMMVATLPFTQRKI